MILFFHFICFVAHYIVSNISKSLNVHKNFSKDKNDCLANQRNHYLNLSAAHKNTAVYDSDTLKFFPPVYVQRYETVAVVLQEAAPKMNIKKVIDFGCAELGFLMYLKKVEGITEILEVDIDEEMLEKNVHKAAPLTTDHLMGRRKKPLDIFVLAGSIADFDDHLIGCDAVIAIEVIEHLTENDFQKMPFNIFNRIKPKIAIFTTPNADFNVLFPKFSDMRHTDHKFEWTRKEFFDWTQSILAVYPEYSVKFYGIGAGPDGTENLGCCSQMVVFYRKDDLDLFLSAREETGGIHNYKLMEHYTYPAYVDPRTTEEKILHEIEYQAAYFCSLDNYYNEESNENEIPLNLLMEFVSGLSSDEEEVKNILRNNGKTLKQKGSAWFLVHKETDSNTSDSSKNEEWLNDDFSESFYDGEGISEENWSTDDEQINVEVVNYQLPKTSQILKDEILLLKNDFFT